MGFITLFYDNYTHHTPLYIDMFLNNLQHDTNMESNKIEITNSKLFNSLDGIEKWKDSLENMVIHNSSCKINTNTLNNICI